MLNTIVLRTFQGTLKELPVGSTASARSELLLSAGKLGCLGTVYADGVSPATTSASMRLRPSFTRPMKPHRFVNVPLLKSFTKRPGSDNELDRRRVNERRNRIDIDAATNATASV